MEKDIFEPIGMNTKLMTKKIKCNNCGMELIDLNYLIEQVDEGLETMDYVYKVLANIHDIMCPKCSKIYKKK